MARAYAGVIDQSAFEPEVTRAMSDAFEAVCSELRISRDSVHEREMIAARIIDLARSGVIDVKSVCERIASESCARV